MHETSHSARDAAEAPVRELTRTIVTSSGKRVTYSPGDYLFELAAKVVVYGSDPGKPLDPDLRARSLVLTALHESALVRSAGGGAGAKVALKDWVQPVLEELYNMPALQQPLAYVVDYVPSKWLLEQEAGKIYQARKMHNSGCPVWPPVYEAARPFDRCDPTTWQAPDTVYAWAREAGLRGLCVSGGGIRSATFNLGILQGLAAQQKLDCFDYLSSVSGGGYIHGWLAAWLRRESGRKQQSMPVDEAAREALKQVQEEMAPIPGAAGPGAKQRTYAPHEIRWLRRFSNYLTPEKGLLTLDTWTAIAIWLRNTFLNQLVLIAALLCLLLLPWLLSKIWHPLDGVKQDKAVSGVAYVRKSDKFKVDYCMALAAEGGGRVIAPASCLPAVKEGRTAEVKSLPKTLCSDKSPGWTMRLEALSFVIFLVGSFSLGHLLRQEYLFTRKLDREEHRDAAGELIDGCKVPYIHRPQSRRDFGSPWRIGLMVAALLFPSLPFCYALCCPGAGPHEVYFAAAALFALSVSVAVGGSAFHWPGTPLTLRTVSSLAWRVGLVCVGASAFGTAVFVLLAALIRTATVEEWGAHLMLMAVPAVELALGLPLLASLPFLTVAVLIGLVGHAFFDWLRELLGRVLAMTLLATLGWLGLFSIALLSPGLFLDAFHGTPLKISSIVAWIATTAASVLSGKSAKTSGSSSAQGGLFTAETLATIGPYVYILGLLVVLSSLIQLWVDVEGALTRIWVAMALSLGVAILLGLRLDATAFSMFPFYRNRLTRCYLGASNRSREPSSLTGFDDRDTRGLQLRCLTPGQGYPGPFPIFCATLNLTTGTELAYQERKGASFAFTPCHTGYAVSWTEAAPGTQFNGFVPTDTYGSPDGGLNVASAMAISGAAVSPNWGFHTKPATAFLLTMFNARLGCWLPNTRKQPASGRKKTKSTSEEGRSPDGRVLFNELLGRTDDSRDFIYLTDGGHFDNMGLYELVRRRCYHIVVCDAEEDEDYLFDGIGQTIRKCRIDFGVEIKIDFSQLRTVAKTRFSSAHMVTGTIRYPESTANQHGTITYIKASLVTFKKIKGAPSDLPDLPGDVQSYYLQHKDFPHDSTLEQWFTESQFESYRRLGQSVIEAIPTALIAKRR